MSIFNFNEQKGGAPVRLKIKNIAWYVWFSYIAFFAMLLIYQIKLHSSKWKWIYIRPSTPQYISFVRCWLASWFIYIVFPLVGVALVVFVIRSVIGYPPFVQTILNALYFVFAYFLGVYATYCLQVWSEKNLPQKPNE